MAMFSKLLSDLEDFKAPARGCGLKLRRQISSRFTRSRNSLRGFAALDKTHIIGLNKINGLYVTESDTLRIAVANVALEDPPIDGVKIHCTEGTYADTGTAADAGVVVHGYAAQRLILRNSLDRTDIQTGRILALLTGHGNIDTFSLPF